jgi:septal ring factor EnvC (AmiA/AmiB activator)
LASIQCCRQSMLHIRFKVVIVVTVTVPRDARLYFSPLTICQPTLAIMIARIVTPMLLLMGMFAFTSTAQAQDNLHQYFVDVASQAQAAESADDKRAILSRGLERMNTALEQAERSPVVTDEDKAGMNQMRASLQDKLDELDGRNGFERVADADLDEFADYMVHDMEQAQRVTISLVALLLIIIIVILVT